MHQKRRVPWSMWSEMRWNNDYFLYNDMESEKLEKIWLPHRGFSKLFNGYDYERNQDISV